jgi:N-glycosylase/DNA lyase
MFLPADILKKYEILKKDIEAKLTQFSKVPKKDYFYELCFCICTPQSKAESAFKVQNILANEDFLTKGFDPTNILRTPNIYIRFHNQKAKRLLEARENWDMILKKLSDNISPEEKREWLNNNVNGIGMKESAHYLRNIGYKDLGILDRHILKHLVLCGVYDKIPNIASKKSYILVEKKFKGFANEMGIPMDHLDLLFWSYEAGLILK